MRIEDLEKHLRLGLQEHEAFDLDAATTWLELEQELGREKRSRKWMIVVLMLSVILFSAIGILLGTNQEEISSFPVGVSDQLFVSTPNQDHVANEGQDLRVKTIALSDRIQIKAPLPTVTTNIQGINGVQSFSLITTVIEEDVKVQEPSNEQAQNQSPSTVAIANALPDASESSSVVATLSHKLPLLNIPVRPIPTVSPIASKEKKPSSIMLDLSYGLSSSQPIITDNGASGYASLRQESETPQWGAQGQLAMSKLYSSGWFWGAGLSCQQAWIKVRHQSQTRDNVPLEDVVTRILIDNETQDTTGVLRGNAADEVMNTRNLQHYNRFRSLSIPVHLGFMWTKSGFSYGLQGGLYLSYMLRQEGRVLLAADQTIFDFEKDNYFNRWRVGVQLRPFIAIPVKHGFNISLNPMVALSVGDELSVDRGIKQRSLNYGFSVGVYKVLRNSKTH